jgi:hypothetical protein
VTSDVGRAFIQIFYYTVKPAVVGVLDRYLAGAAIHGSLDDSVDICGQTMPSVLPLGCSGVALPHTPDSEAAFQVSKYRYVHQVIP